MAKRKTHAVIADEQLQLAFEQLVELKAMAPLVFRGVDVSEFGGKKLAARREELRAQADKLLAARRRA